ncbi:unnamed protein product, partial [Prorocentrum cordatum]
MGTWPLRCWFKLPQLIATWKSLATPPSASIEMGCCMASYRSQADRPAEGGRGEEAEGVGALAAALLGRLQQQARPSVAPLTTPVQRHADRVPSGERGLSLVALGALETFYAAQGALGKV